MTKQHPMIKTITFTLTQGGLTAKEVAEKRRIDRKVFSGNATRKDILRGLELKNRRDGGND